MTIESRTTAPTSTRTPGDRTELTTVPAITQPWLMRLLWTCAVGPTLAGARSSERVWMTQSLSYRSSSGSSSRSAHVGLPERLDRPDVLPVAVVAIAEDAGAGVEHGRDDVGPEVDPILGQPASQRLLREDVDAHRGEVALGLLGLLLPLDDPVVLVEGEDAHPRRLGQRHAADGDRHVGAVAAVGRHERLVVHLVDVVAGEDQDDVGRVVLDDVDVAQDGIGRAAVPLGELAALDVRLEQLDPAAVAVEVPRPAEADVVVERARVVLGQDDDVIDVRVDAVGQREVDDPVLAAERHGRLGPLLGEDREAFALAAREDHRHRPLHAVDASTRRWTRRMNGTLPDG